MSAAKALVQVEFPVLVLSPYEEEKWKNCYVQNAVILSKIIFSKYQISSSKCSISLHCAKYQMPAAKAPVPVEYPLYALRTQNSYEEEK